jgi:hypothetical protein
MGSKDLFTRSRDLVAASRDYRDFFINPRD